MATHSSILAWEIPWTEEPGGLQSLGSQRVTWTWPSAAECEQYALSSWAVPGLYLMLVARR